MKSERRHDLKTNELAEWLSHLPEFWQKNYKTVIYIVIIVIIVGVAVYAKWYRKRAEFTKLRTEITEFSTRVAQSKVDAVMGLQQGIDYSNRLLVTADSLETASRRADDPVSAALALNKRAEALRAELHYRPESLEPQAAGVQIEQAVKCYEKALEKGHGNTSLNAMSEFGLGLCAEEVGDSAKATSIYRQIVANPDYEGTIFVHQARRRLETIEEYGDPVYFTESVSQVQRDQIVFQPQAEDAEPLVMPSDPYQFDINELTQ